MTQEVSTKVSDDKLLSQAKEARVRLDKYEKADTQANNHLTSCAMVLKDLKENCKTQKQFLALTKQVGIGKSRTYELLQIAEGKETAESLRKKKADAQAQTRAKAKTVNKPKAKKVLDQFAVDHEALAADFADYAVEYLKNNSAKKPQDAKRAIAEYIQSQLDEYFH